MINRSILGILTTALRPQNEVKEEKGCKNTNKQNQIYERTENDPVASTVNYYLGQTSRLRARRGFQHVFCVDLRQ